jgi:hypothetical protein
MTLLCFTTDYCNKIDITQRDGFHQIYRVCLAMILKLVWRLFENAGEQNIND